MTRWLVLVVLMSLTVSVQLTLNTTCGPHSYACAATPRCILSSQVRSSSSTSSTSFSTSFSSSSTSFTSSFTSSSTSTNNVDIWSGL